MAQAKCETKVVDKSGPRRSHQQRAQIPKSQLLQIKQIPNPKSRVVANSSAAELSVDWWEAVSLAPADFQLKRSNQDR